MDPAGIYFEKGGEKKERLCYNKAMLTPIDFGKNFLNRYFDQKDEDACLEMLAEDLVWITPEDMHHFLSRGAVLKFLRKSLEEDSGSKYVDLISIKSSPSADNIMTVAYEVNLVSREDERPLYLRCSMVICRRSKKLEITFLHFSRKAERDSSERLRGFLSNLPCGVMILACLDGQREEAVFYNEYFARRLHYGQAEFAHAMEQNPFFMASEEDRENLREQIGQARRTGGNIAVKLRFFRRDGNSFYYRMIGSPAYQADGGTVYYCIFQEITGFRLANERLETRLETAKGILRQIPEAICAIEYPPAADRAAETGQAEAAGKPGRKSPRVFFTSRNIPDLFGVSNSAFMKNILLDPFYGLEITSITRDRLQEMQLFGGTKAGSAGPVSCGIFRLKKVNSPVDTGLFTSEVCAEEPQTSAGSHRRNRLRDFGSGVSAPERFDVSEKINNPVDTGLFTPEDCAEGPQTSAGSTRAEKSAQKRNPQKAGAGPEEEAHRVELVVRRVREKDGTVRLYLLYYDREAQQREMEERVDRAMKMGRAGLEQLREELRRVRENARQRQSEQKAELQAAGEKHEAEIRRAENRLAEEKNRTVLLSRQLEESRAAQKQAADSLARIQEEAAGTIRAGREKAQQEIREAAAAKELLEEQLREALERSRKLEKQLRKERTRRVMLEERLREGGSPVSDMPEGAAEGKKSLQGIPGVYGAEPGADWMTQSQPLTVISSMDPAMSTGPAPAAVSRAGVRMVSSAIVPGLPAPRTEPWAGAAGVENAVREAVRETAQREAAQREADSAGEKAAFLAERRIRAREQEKAQRRLQRLMERAAHSAENLSGIVQDFREAAMDEQLLQEREFSPEVCLENVLRFEDIACTEKEITLRLYRDSRLPLSVRGFSGLLRRALCELLENAINSSPRGGLICVHCRADRPSAGIVNMHFRIDDNGKGISPSRMQTIFEAEREAGTDKPVHSGLFAAKEAAALMGGSVHARSGPGGSRFTLSVALRV